MHIDVEQGEITEKPVTKKTRKFGKGPTTQKPNPQEPPKIIHQRNLPPVTTIQGGSSKGNQNPQPLSTVHPNNQAKAP
jgi:hypothetical protein